MKLRNWIPVLVLLAVFICTARCAAPTAAHAAILQTLAEALKLSSVTPYSNWDPASSNNACGVWTGVGCDAGGFVQTLDISSRNYISTTATYLRPSLPTELSGLTTLKELIIRDSNISGTLPDLSQSTGLRKIDLYNSWFSTIPASLCGLPALEELNLEYNTLSNWTIALNACFPNMTKFNIARNSVRGTVPAIDGLQNLREFNIYSNNFGTLFTSLANLPSLEVLWLHFNPSLTGTLPSVSGLTSLKSLIFSNTTIGGSIDSLLNAPNLETVSGDFSLIGGPFPDLNPNIITISCKYCRFTGNLPNFALFSRLNTTILDRNQLSGQIPALPASMKYLSLPFNGFDGNIPILPASMTSVVVDGNRLTGPIPTLPTTLLRLTASNNSLSGDFPALPSGLIILDLSSNAVTGSIASLPSSLVLFHVGGNKIEGTLPALPSLLLSFNISNNLLTGSLPTSYNIITSFDASGNGFTGSVPDLTATVLSVYMVARNQLTGAIPGSFASNARISRLDLSYNRLTGLIPALLNMDKLTYINLAGNLLSGKLPIISTINPLAFIDFSSNNLTGAIWDSWPYDLRSISLSNNSLECMDLRYTGSTQFTKCDLSLNRLCSTVDLNSILCTYPFPTECIVTPCAGGSAASNTVVVAISVVVAVILVIVIAVIIACCVCVRAEAQRSTNSRDNHARVQAAEMTAMQAQQQVKQLEEQLKYTTFNGAYAGEFLKEWLIDARDLVFEREIGRGSQGAVWFGKMREAKVAIKLATSNTVDTSAVEALKNEAKLVLGLRGHPNIVQAYGVCVDQGHFYIVLEYCKGGSVQSQFGKGTLSPDKKLQIVRDLASGLSHLHSSGLLHCDVSCRNILLSGDKAKLTDFGLTQSATSRKSVLGQNESMLGPVRWSSPEMIRNHEYSQASDVWMFAAAVCELYTETVPFPEYNDTQAAIAVAGGSCPPLPQGAPPQILQLLQYCFHKDPSQRPSMHQLCQMLNSTGRMDDDTFVDPDWDPKWLIRLSDLQFLKELGKGAYGSVWEGLWKSSRVAIKEARDIPAIVAHRSEKDPLAELRKEARLMLALRPHNNVVATYGICVEKSTLYLIIEFCGMGAADSYYGRIGLVQKVKILRDAALGLAHLHDCGLVHRDVATRNILIADGFVGKIGDFGYARMYDVDAHQGFTQSNVGPLRWMAPESVFNRVYSPHSDTWMFGMTMLEMLTEHSPWANCANLMEVPTMMQQQSLPQIPTEIPESLSRIMLACLQYIPNARPTLQQVAAALSSFLDSNPV